MGKRSGMCSCEEIPIRQVRRVVRLLVFVLSCVFVCVVWLWVLWDARTVVVYGVDPSQPLELHVDNCQVLVGRVSDPTTSLGVFRDMFASRGNSVDRSRFVVGVAMHDVSGAEHEEVSPGVFRVRNAPDALAERYACRNNPFACRTCRVFLMAQNDAPWPNATFITSNSSANTVEVADFALGDPFVAPNSTLRIRGPNVRVTLTNAILGHLDVVIGDGTVSLPELTLTEAASNGLDDDGLGGSRVVTGDGDVYISSTAALNMSYFQLQSRSCIVAPQIAQFDETCYEYNTTTAAGVNTTATACRGTALLCGRGEDCSPFDEYVQLHVESASGSVHASAVGGLTDAAAALVDPASSRAAAALQTGKCTGSAPASLLENVTIKAGAGMLLPDVDAGTFLGFASSTGTVVGNSSSTGQTNAVGLHPSSKSTILGVKQWLDEAPGFDFVVYIQIEGQPPRDTWMYGSKAAIVQLDPGWLSTFSLGILRPRVRHVRLRLAPAMCPLGVAELTPFGGAIWSTLRDELDIQPGQVLHHEIADDLRCGYELQGATASGQSLFLREDVTMKSNLALLVVVVMTFVIPFITFVTAYSSMQAFLFWAVEHVTRSYAEREQYDKLTKATADDAGSTARSSATERRLAGKRKKVNISTRRKQEEARANRRQPGDCSWRSCCCQPRGWFTRARRVALYFKEMLPAPYDVSEALINMLIRSQRNSMRVFLRACMMKIASPTPADERGDEASPGEEPTSDGSPRAARRLSSRRTVPSRRSVAAPDSAQAAPAEQAAPTPMRENRYDLSHFKARCT